MLELDAQHIKQIEERIGLIQLKNKTLAVDLVDHICCMIEERVDLGISLEQAENEVMKQMGEVQLQAIDIETTYLTQNKITMKKRTKIIGLVSLLLIATGFTFKMLHLPGASITWALGILTAAFGFFLFSLLDRFSYEKSNYMRINSVVGYLGSALLIVGLGMVLLRWPLATYLAESGSILLLIYFILNNSYSRNPGKK